MSNSNPSKPPDPDSRKNPGVPDVPGSPLRAVLSGLAVDIAGSELLNLLLAHVYTWSLSGQGLTDSELDDAALHIPLASGFGVLSLVLGALMSVAGGYVCARIVLRDEYRVGGIMAAVSGMLGLMVGASDDFSSLSLLLILCTVSCNLLGVKYGSEQNRRLQALSVPPSESSTP